MKLKKYVTKTLAFILAVSLAWVPMGKMEYVKAETGTVVEIPDEGLRDYLYEELEKSEENGDVITREDLEGITSVSLRSLYVFEDISVADLTGLEYCTNLEALEIYSGAKTLDFSILENFDNLKELCIVVPVVDDISAIEGLSKLETLRLDASGITVLPDCSAMTNLQGLNLGSCTSLEDISGITNCNNLVTVKLGATAVKDITPLKGKIGIIELDLEQVEITPEYEQGYMETISSLTNLKTLYMNYCDITDKHISMLDSLTNLSTLVMGMNDVSTTDFLLKHKDTMVSLMITGNPVTDGSNFAQMSKLKILGIDDTRITDFSFVSQLSALTNGFIYFLEWDPNYPTVTSSKSKIAIKNMQNLYIANDVKDANGNLIAPIASESYSYNETTGRITIPVTSINEQRGNLKDTIRYEFQMQTQSGDTLFVEHSKDVDVLWLKENPESLELNIGESGTLSVSAVGSEAYQWYKDDEPIEGATSAELELSNVTKSDEGSYTVEIYSNFDGESATRFSVRSDVAIVTVGGAVTITEQPQDVTLIEGENGTLSVTASGESALSYQWYKDNVALSGKTSSTLALNNVTTADTGTYKVEVSDEEGNKVTSNEVTVTVQNALAITKQPIVITVKEGESGSLSVTAKGHGTLSYQWYKGDTAIEGATEATLNFDNVTVDDAGSYKVVVSDENSTKNGAVTSETVNVVVQKAVVITKQPENIIIVEGKKGSFTVEAVGEGALTYQWYKDGVAIEGATTATLTLNNVTMADAGKYIVMVKDSIGGAITSRSATITLQNALKITGQPSGIILKKGESGSLTVTAEGHGTLSYQWYKGDETIPGATSATLKLENITADDMGVYKVVVSDENSAVNGTVTSNTVNVVVQNVLAIMKQPVNIAIVEGKSGSITVEAMGEGNLTYQWYKDGTAIEGATTATLILNNVTMSDAGNYTVKVTDSIGSKVTSEIAVVTVQNALEITKQPTGITLKEGESGNLTVTAEGHGTLSYQWYKGDEAIPGATAATLKLENVTANDAGNYKVKITDSNGSVISEVAAVKVQSPLVITKQPEGIALVEGKSGSLTVKAKGEGTLNYQWYKGNKVIKGATKATLSFKTIKMSDAGKYKVEVKDSTGAVVASDVVAVTVQNALEITKQPIGITLIEGEPGSLTVKAEGEGNLTYQWYKGLKAIKGANKATLNFDKVTFSDEGKYKVKITDSTTGMTVISEKVKVEVQKALKITKQPEGVKLKEGKKATLTVKAEGEGKLSYQWYKNEEAIEGATKDTLKFAKLKMSDAGIYTVEISDKNGSVFSNAIKVEVTSDNKKAEKPIMVEEADTTLKITKQPVGIRLKQGENGYLTVEASGGGMLKYQWYKDGVAIAALSGGTEATLKLNNATIHMVGTYKVVVSDDDETVTSEEVKVTVDNVISKTNTTKSQEELSADNTSQNDTVTKDTVKEPEKAEKSDSDKSKDDKAETDKSEPDKTAGDKAENAKAEDNKSEDAKSQIKEEEVKLEDKNQENKTDAESIQTTASENVPESNGNMVLIVILIIVLLAIAGVVVYLKKKQ